MSCLRERHPRVRVDDACGLFVFTRQAYYQGFRRGYESSVEIDSVLEAVRLYNAERPHLSLNMNTPEHVYRTSCETHRLWKNYYPYYESVTIFD